MLYHFKNVLLVRLQTYFFMLYLVAQTMVTCSPPPLGMYIRTHISEILPHVTLTYPPCERTSGFDRLRHEDVMLWGCSLPHLIIDINKYIARWFHCNYWDLHYRNTSLSRWVKTFVPGTTEFSHVEVSGSSSAPGASNWDTRTGLNMFLRPQIFSKNA